MSGRDVLQGQGCQQWKADDNAKGNDDQGTQIGPVRSTLRKGKQQANRQQAGNGGAGDGQENRVEIRDCDTCGGQRRAKNRDTNEAVYPTAFRSGHPAPLFYKQNRASEYGVSVWRFQAQYSTI